jgi:hypothetical protein
MGFFSLLETFFFISLAITFVLIIMLVYHFKGRLVSIEDRYHTMFDIVNSLVKEMKNLRDTMIQVQAQVQAQAQPPQLERSPFGGNAPTGFPTDLFRLFQSGPGMFPSSRVGENEQEDDDEDNYRKIVVSDTELDDEEYDEDDEENENNVRVISVDITEPNESVSLAELEDPVDIDITPEDEEVEEELNIDETDEPSMDYRKLDVSYLKTMVLTRGLATDTKKMKKSDLIRLLEEAI